ncbi:hypothetical protein L2Y96_04520 [Luteibacter aegosomaticola]|uniref:hypothetical protein n=1 Tax=Luteibacter aegosomaticola TaxID=2911538 RepID=UPI001FF77732|nr:hypothetical protein [Luteibacter aegosomaticola]UPG91050.1 hypothetical protein L2Y96_04520 [Luteibacter aegosomaticola]
MVRTLIVAGLLCLGLPTLVSAGEPVTRTSPTTSFSTTRSPDAFVACLLPVVQKTYPQSSAAAKGDDREMHVVDSSTPGNLAEIDVRNDGRLRSLVLIRTESPQAATGRRLITAARQCS